MQVLISHWHCIVPAVAIMVGLALMRRKPARQGRETREGEGSEENRVYNEE